MAYWYLGIRDSELLLDLDVAGERSKISGVKRIEVFRRRLQDAILGGKLAFKKLWIARSNTEHKFHAVILLSKPLPLMERLTWQFHLCSDLLRAKCDFMRAARGIVPASLLIRNEKLPGFYREPDAECPCTEKHDTDKMLALGEKACAVWLKYRGRSPYELFGKRDKSKQHVIWLPLGEVPVQLILRKEREG
jgi:hypothetical protein